MIQEKKLEVLAIIWGVGGALIALTILFAQANFGVILVLGFALMAATLAVIDPGSNKTKDDESTSSREKPKRGEGSQSGSSDALLRLLSEEDLEELRQRVKQRLLDNIEQGGDGELSSLDALLSEQQSRQRR